MVTMEYITREKILLALEIIVPQSLRKCDIYATPSLQRKEGLYLRPDKFEEECCIRMKRDYESKIYDKINIYSLLTLLYVPIDFAKTIS